MIFRSDVTARARALLAVIGLAVLAMHPASSADARWPTDEPLRAAMAAIRKATLDNHTLVTHRRMPPADARRFADTIAKQASIARTGAQISPEAKAELEPILADIVSGADAVAGLGGALTPIDGIIQIDAALVRYPLRFDDPTWQPLR
ncbi:MAG: hypothetical protein J0H65_04910 [Rhizobiales bacterium]|nr:hypothetical protein [Hyphomicrobiales bacterium]